MPGRLLKDPRLPEVPQADRKPIYDTMADALAALHAVDPVASGLESFGPPKDFVSRRTSASMRGSGVIIEGHSAETAVAQSSPSLENLQPTPSRLS